MTQDSTGVGAAGGAVNASAHGARSLKAKAAEEFRRFVILFFYLWILFSVFVINQGVALREHGINFTLHPGRWLRAWPLIYPILYETSLLTILFIVVHVAEKTIEGLIRGKTVGASLPSIGGGGLAGLSSAAIILFAALVPFFGLRNLSLAMGEGRLYAMIFGARHGRAKPRSA